MSSGLLLTFDNFQSFDNGPSQLRWGFICRQVQWVYVCVCVCVCVGVFGVLIWTAQLTIPLILLPVVLVVVIVFFLSCYLGARLNLRQLSACWAFFVVVVICG